jgi:hypothetical protein
MEGKVNPALICFFTAEWPARTEEISSDAPADPG